MTRLFYLRWSLCSRMSGPDCSL